MWSAAIGVWLPVRKSCLFAHPCKHARVGAAGCLAQIQESKRKSEAPQNFQLMVGHGSYTIDKTIFA